MPVKQAGIRIEPPTSDPMPTTDPAAARIAPSPPVLPPTILKNSQKHKLDYIWHSICETLEHFLLC